MSKFQRLSLIVTTCGLLLTSAWAADKNQHDPGGKGILDSRWFLDECFKPASGTVTEVCGKFKISWKMWTLLGEPVGDYNLAWKLSSIKLMDPQRKVASSFTAGSLPNELKKPARVIELYIDSYATVNANPGVYHRFNTGVAVRADAGSSFNVPGSTHWNEVFALGSLPCEPLHDAFVGGRRSQQGDYLDADQAKRLFNQGIQLSNLQLCKESGVSELSSLEDAIGKMCEKPGADKQYKFCPKVDEKPKKEDVKAAAKLKNKQKESSAGLRAGLLDGDNSASPLNVESVLDESAENSAIQKRLSQEIATYRRSAEPACRNTMQSIDACFEKTGCKRVDPNPSIEECKSIPSRPSRFRSSLVLTRVRQPGDVCYIEDAECLAAKRVWAAENEERERREAEEMHRSQNEWDSRYSNLVEECKVRSKEREMFGTCQRQFESTCNPKHFNSTSDCLDEQVRINGPSEKDARKLMKKTWEDRSKNGTSLRNSILD